MNKPTFELGDLVRVAGYHPRVFEVDGRRIEQWQYADEEWSVIVYELFDCATAEWIEAEEGDLTIVAEAVDAESYLAANPAPVEAPRMPGLDFDLSEFFGGGEVMFGKKPQEPRKPTARELSAQEAERRKAARKEKAAKVDELLDRRNWYSAALERTNNEEFGDRVAAIDRELKKLTDEK